MSLGGQGRKVGDRVAGRADLVSDTFRRGLDFLHSTGDMNTPTLRRQPARNGTSSSNHVPVARRTPSAACCLAVLVLTSCGEPAAQSPTGRYPGDFKTVAFETDEGTAMNVDVAPDGRELVFDLL